MGDSIVAIVASSHSRFDGSRSPRIRAHATRIAPDTTNRDPPMRNGGMVSTLYRIARYVEPQMTYTAANAAISRTREWRSSTG